MLSVEHRGRTWKSVFEDGTFFSQASVKRVFVLKNIFYTWKKIPRTQGWYFKKKPKREVTIQPLTYVTYFFHLFAFALWDKTTETNVNVYKRWRQTKGTCPENPGFLFTRKQQREVLPPLQFSKKATFSMTEKSVCVRTKGQTAHHLHFKNHKSIIVLKS